MAKSKAVATKKGGAVGKPSSFKDELAKYAQDQSAREPAGAGGDYISIRNSKFSYKGDNLPAPLKVVILDYSFENAYYTEKFDQDNPTPPACFAVHSIDPEKNNLGPHNTSPEPQHETCKGCEQNEWGTADVGGGKACKNNRRLLVISADDLTVKGVDNAGAALIRLPPTSLKNWRGYVKKINDGLKVPLAAVVTSLDFDEDEDYPVVVPQFVEEIDDQKVFQALLKKREENYGKLLEPFDVSNYGAEKKPKKGAKGKKDVKGKKGAKNKKGKF